MKNIIIAVVVILILVGGFLFLSSSKNSNNTSKTASSSSQTANAGATIEFKDGVFSPSSVLIKSGTKITWVNRSPEEIQIGANPHPIHDGNRELSGGEFVLTLESGDSKSVTLNQTGTFSFHNHLQAGEGGTVIVK